MPFIYRGMRCKLCGQRINSDEKTFLIPSIFLNKNDELYKYNDIIVHENCFLYDKNYNKIKNLINSVQEEYKKKICCICIEKIINADDFIFLPILSSNINDPLYKHNCKAFHKNCYIKSDVKNIVKSNFINELNINTIGGQFKCQ